MTDEKMNGVEPSETQAGAGETALPGESSAEQVAQVNAELEEQVKTLQAELEQVQAKSKEYFEGWQRERADFQNYKRRVERDQSQQAQMMAGTIIKKYLVILDDLERALKNRPTEGDTAGWANGIELIQRKLQQILEAEGVQRIPAETESFDPTRHEAISHEESEEHESGQVIEVLQHGYIIGDRVLRPAMVRVAK